MRQSITESPLPLDHEDVLDIASVAATPARWMIVARDGHLLQFDSETGEQIEAGHVDLPQESNSEPWAGHELTPRLHVSANGSFVAIVNDYGKLGVVYDARRNRITLKLHGGEDDPETVPFSFGFVEHDGRTVAIHRTSWNRLDASDAASGDLLTQRGPTHYGQGEATPEHYLDYFHGRLLLNPSGTRIADDGWVWHPVGITETWEVRPWLERNVWESEDGASKMTICARDYYWDHAMCWLDNETLAVGGIGEDDEDMIEGVRVFSVAEAINWKTENFSGHGGREIATFEGPSGQFFGGGERLFSTDRSGLAIWDVATQSLADRVEAFFPTRQHTGSRELVELRGSVLRRLRY